MARYRATVLLPSPGVGLAEQALLDHFHRVDPEWGQVNRFRRGSLDLHGHSHGKLTPATRQYDVGVDVQDLRPATLDQILARKRQRRPAVTKITQAE